MVCNFLGTSLLFLLFFKCMQVTKPTNWLPGLLSMLWSSFTWWIGNRLFYKCLEVFLQSSTLMSLLNLEMPTRYYTNFQLLYYYTFKWSISTLLSGLPHWMDRCVLKHFSFWNKLERFSENYSLCWDNPILWYENVFLVPSLCTVLLHVFCVYSFINKEYFEPETWKMKIWWPRYTT